MKIWLSLLTLLSLLDSTWSCGGFFCWPEQPILQAGETIAFGVTENEEAGTKDIEMIVQIVYTGPAANFSWVLPVMVEPTLSVGYDGMFTTLFDATRPTFELNVDNDQGTCSEDALQDQICAVAFMDMAGSAAGGPTVLQEDTVGPFSTVVLQPAEENPGESVFNWLQENKYDQPEESFALIDYYARQGQLFVALKLKKDAQAGDIQPIILKYSLPIEMRNVACVPIQLTSIAATPDMPIQVYVMSEARAFPVNYFDVELDDTQVDWVGCLNSPNCYINDMRDRLKRFLQEEGINDHAFVTEYAGPSSILGSDSVSLKLDIELLASTTSVADIFTVLTDAGIPFSALVTTILERYIPKSYAPETPGLCTSGSLWSSLSTFCAPMLINQTIDAMAATNLAQELNTSLIQPSIEAQDFLNAHTYLTRFYGQMSPNTMDKDPFFAFNEELPDVSHIHRATGAPVCEGDAPFVVPSALDITVERGNRTVRQPAELACGNWIRPGGGGIPLLPTLFNNMSSAIQAVAHGYTGDMPRTISRSLETGRFSPEVVANIVEFMDSRVPNQTVPPFTRPGVVSADDGQENVQGEDGNEVDLGDIDETEVEEVETIDPESEVDIEEVEDPVEEEEVEGNEDTEEVEDPVEDEVEDKEDIEEVEGPAEEEEVEEKDDTEDVEDPVEDEEDEDAGEGEGEGDGDNGEVANTVEDVGSSAFSHVLMQKMCLALATVVVTVGTLSLH